MEEELCTLLRWQSSGALVSVNNDLFSVDPHCTLTFDPKNPEECAENNDNEEDASNVYYLVTVIVVPICFLLVIASLLTIMVLLHRYSRLRQTKVM